MIKLANDTHDYLQDTVYLIQFPNSEPTSHLSYIFSLQSLPLPVLNIDQNPPPPHLSPIQHPPPHDPIPLPAISTTPNPLATTKHLRRPDPNLIPTSNNRITVARAIPKILTDTRYVCDGDGVVTAAAPECCAYEERKEK